MASTKCRTGKMLPTALIHVGVSSPSGMKMPERNSSGRIVALTIGGAASAFGITGGDRQRQRAKLEPAHQQRQRRTAPAGLPVGTRRRVEERRRTPP